MPTVDAEMRAILADTEALYAALELVLDAIPLDPPARNMARLVIAAAVDELVRGRPLLARVDEYNAAMLDYERRDGWYTLAEERAGATARHAEKRLWAAIAARAAYAGRGGAPDKEDT